MGQKEDKFLMQFSKFWKEKYWYGLLHLQNFQIRGSGLKKLGVFPVTLWNFFGLVGSKKVFFFFFVNFLFDEKQQIRLLGLNSVLPEII